jgi:hypothetical protein
MSQAPQSGYARTGVAVLPAALAAFHVLGFYVQTGVGPFTVLRALVAALAVSIAITVLASKILRDPGKATLVATAAVFGIIGWRGLAQLALAGVLAAMVIVVLPRLLRIRFPWALVVPAGNALAFILMATLLITAAQNGTIGLRSPR